VRDRLPAPPAPAPVLHPVPAGPPNPIRPFPSRTVTAITTPSLLSPPPLPLSRCFVSRVHPPAPPLPSPPTGGGPPPIPEINVLRLQLLRRLSVPIVRCRPHLFRALPPRLWPPAYKRPATKAIHFSFGIREKCSRPSTSLILFSAAIWHSHYFDGDVIRGWLEHKRAGCIVTGVSRVRFVWRWCGKTLLHELRATFAHWRPG